MCISFSTDKGKDIEGLAMFSSEELVRPVASIKDRHRVLYFFIKDQGKEVKIKYLESNKNN
jgi:hypothetical protein